MGLRPCLTCEAMISTNARRCPQCGEPSPHTSTQTKRIVLVVGVIIMLVWIGFILNRVDQGDREMREFDEKHKLPH